MRDVGPTPNRSSGGIAWEVVIRSQYPTADGAPDGPPDGTAVGEAPTGVGGGGVTVGWTLGAVEVVQAARSATTPRIGAMTRARRPAAERVGRIGARVPHVRVTRARRRRGRRGSGG